MSATPLSPLSDTSTLLGLDEAWAIPCERENKPFCEGQNAAEWIVRFAPCCPARRTHALWCGSCKDEVLSLMDRVGKSHCPLCGRVSSSPAEAFVLIEPLDGGHAR